MTVDAILHTIAICMAAVALGLGIGNAMGPRR